MTKAFKKQWFNVYKIIGLTIFGLLLISKHLLHMDKDIKIIMAWVQAKNEHKLLPAVIFHFGVNLFCRLFLFGRIGWQSYLLLSAFFIVIALILFLTDKKTFLAKRINDSVDKV